MCRKLIYLICFVLVLGLFGSVAQARPLVYEPFDYASIGDSLNGQSGDAIGLSGAWVTSTGGDVADFLISDDLGPYGVLTTAGNAVKRLNPGRTEAHRPIDGSVALPSTTWFSVLYDPSDRHAGFAITSTPFGNSAAADFGLIGHGFGFIQDRNPDLMVKPAIWSNGTVATRNNNGLDVSPGTDIRLIVGKIEFDAGAGGTDIVTLYDVGADLKLPDPFASVEADADQSRVSMIGIQANREVVFDEIRIGGTLKDVLGLPSDIASGPNPSDQETDVPRDVALSWTPGDYADKHDVYFGTDFNDVNDANRTNSLGVLVSQNQDPTSYSLAEVLQFDQTYYWRVDEVNAPPDFTIYKGAVWRFTAEPFAYPIENIIATASSQFNADSGPENTINGSGLDDNDLHTTDNTAMWLSSAADPNAAWIRYEFDRIYKLHQMWVWNHNTSLEPILGYGIKDATIEYSVDGTTWTTLGTTYEFARASGAPGYAHNTTVGFGGVPAKYIKITANSNWGGVLNQYGLSEVRFFHIPVFAREPDPASGATNADVDAVLIWREGREAASHNVYFSTDQQVVIDETISPINVPAGRSYANYATGPLNLAQAYYWKVNEVNEAETPATWQGDVWNFGTQEYLVVDDFEDYNDFEPDRIFDTWIDGWGDPTNGSQVSSDVPPFAEQTIVHGGKQSMPLNYDNSTASHSEATANVANLPIGQDWTKSGIKTLSLWFYGDSSNSVTEKMYVKLNGAKVLYDGNADSLTRTTWQPWNINLVDFGVNLSNVTELSIGLERSGVAGGMGVVYIDDIRLYPYDRQFITPTEPSQAGLIGHWKFDGDTQDYSGLGNHGTAGVTPPAFVAGRVGSNALDFRGADYVVIDGVVDDITSTNITLSAWVKTTQINEGNVFAANDSASSHPLMFGVSGGNPFVNDGGDTQFPPAVNDGQWHILTYVRSGSTGYVYVDGLLRGTYSAGFDLGSVTRWSIGQEWDDSTPSNFYVGLVDDARIYDRVLSPEEVAWLAGRRQPFDKPF